MAKIVEHSHNIIVAIGSGAVTVEYSHRHKVADPGHKHVVTCEPAHIAFEDVRPMSDEDLV